MITVLTVYVIGFVAMVVGGTWICRSDIAADDPTSLGPVITLSLIWPLFIAVAVPAILLIGGMGMLARFFHRLWPE